MKKEGYFDKNENIVAINQLRISPQNEVILSGNKHGLIMLADYIVNIALSDVSGTHLHLDAENFFDDANCDLIISKLD